MEKKSKKFPLNFFYKKTIFITGINGFKGFWLYLILKYLGARVYGVGLKKDDYLIFKKLKVKESNFYKEIDIINYKKLKNFIKSKNPDIIFHLASESLVIDCYKKPLKAIQTNLLGLSNLLSILREIKIKKKIGINVVTSDKCYLPKFKRSYIETDELGGNDIYSATKACQEILTQSFSYSFFKENKNVYINTLRAGNVIGGGDYSKNRLFPDIYRSIKNNTKLSIRNLNSSRPWQHVLDCINGYLLAAKFSYLKKKKFDSWNFSSEYKSKKVSEILDILVEKKILKKKIIKFIKNKIDETKYLNLNSRKAKKILKWNSAYKLNDSIKETFLVYDILDKKIHYSKKKILLNKRLTFFLEKVYGNSFRSK